MVSEWVANLMCFVCLCSGMLLVAVLAWAERRTLVCGAEREDRTPQKIGDKFYYIVPEADYCRLTTTLARYRELYELIEDSPCVP